MGCLRLPDLGCRPDGTGPVDRPAYDARVTAATEDELRSEIATQLALPDDELYAAVVPADLRSQMYSKDGLVARGRSIFTDVVRRNRLSLCQVYHRNKESIRDAIDLAVLVVPLVAAAAPGLPAVAVAALVAKIGLDQLCKDVHPAAG